MPHRSCNASGTSIHAAGVPAPADAAHFLVVHISILSVLDPALDLAYAWFVIFPFRGWHPRVVPGSSPSVFFSLAFLLIIFSVSYIFWFTSSTSFSETDTDNFAHSRPHNQGWCRLSIRELLLKLLNLQVRTVEFVWRVDFVDFRTDVNVIYSEFHEDFPKFTKIFRDCILGIFVTTQDKID